jgi:hypothetical protein
VLNERTIPGRYPFRHIHDYSHQLGCRFFSKIDLVQAYNLIPVNSSDAHTTPFGLLEFPTCLSAYGKPRKHFSAGRQ